MERPMLNKMDSPIKVLLWFLFQPEEAPEAQHLEEVRRRFGNGLAAEFDYQGMLKSVVWIILSILLSLTLAHLK